MRKTFVLLLLLAVVPIAPLHSAPPATNKPNNRSQASAERSQKMERARKIAALNRKFYKLFKVGKYDECKRLLKKILRTDPDNFHAYYNLACIHALNGKPDEAIRNLDIAVEKGYSNFRHMERDIDLKSLHNKPAYKKLLARREEIQQTRAKRLLKSLREQFGDDYICEIDHANKLVFATNVDRQTLNELKAFLPRYAESQWKNLFSHSFEQYVTIVIPKKPRSVRARVGGYYSHSRQMLVTRTIGMTLRHEFTHALHFADQDALGQSHPLWIAEGLATLFESSRLAGGKVFPQPNRRLNVLKRLAGQKMTLPFNELFGLSHGQFMRKAMISYPQSRYVMMYLFEHGLLKKWYDAYTSGYEKDKTGAKAMEKVFGKPLEEIETSWLGWVKRQDAPPIRLPARHAYIGIRMRSRADGLEIVQVVPGSGADKAGLKTGDLIVKLDSQRIVDPGELLRVVYAHKVGDKVNIRYRRAERYRNVTVILGPMPSRIAAPEPLPDEPRPAPKPKTKPASQPAASQPAKKAA